MDGGRAPHYGELPRNAAAAGITSCEVNIQDGDYGDGGGGGGLFAYIYDILNQRGKLYTTLTRTL